MKFLFFGMAPLCALSFQETFFSLRISWTSEADEGLPVLVLCLKAAADAVTSAPSRQFRCSEQAAAAYLASQDSDTGHQGRGEHIKVVHTQSEEMCSGTIPVTC